MEAVQERFIWEDEVAVAERLVGIVGEEVSAGAPPLISSAPISQLPVLDTPSISVENERLVSADRSVPESLADVSDDERWKSLLAESTKETV